MIYEQILHNLNKIIGDNKICENVYNTFKFAEKTIQNKEVILRIDPKMTEYHMRFDVVKLGTSLVFGQKYLDTYNQNSSIHHTIYIHECKHLYDYFLNKLDYIAVARNKEEQYQHELDATMIEAEFIKYYLVGNYNLTKSEKYLLKSFDNDDIDSYTIIYHKKSEKIYTIFKNLRKEYKKNHISKEELIFKLVQDASSLIDGYYYADDNFSRYSYYIKIDTFKNSLLYILAIIESNKITWEDLMMKYPDISFIFDKMDAIIYFYKKEYNQYLLYLDKCIENNCMIDVNI